ncbi:hypothetical protein CPC08DRAFT_763767 [Agrocybe pediades]|nr:hypothetical protein CPC08DRAFT_763767 [Agrocybe pediades]
MSSFPTVNSPLGPFTSSGSAPCTPAPSWRYQYGDTGITSYYSGGYPSTPAVGPAPGMTPPCSTPTRPIKKRKDADKENGPAVAQKKRKVQLSVFEKLQLFYGFLKKDLDWSYAELLYHTSCYYALDTQVPLATSLDTNASPQPSIGDGRLRASRQQIPSCAASILVIALIALAFSPSRDIFLSYRQEPWSGIPQELQGLWGI